MLLLKLGLGWEGIDGETGKSVLDCYCRKMAPALLTGLLFSWHALGLSSVVPVTGGLSCYSVTRTSLQPETYLPSRWPYRKIL